jgi:hypothetical protein
MGGGWQVSPLSHISRVRGRERETEKTRDGKTKHTTQVMRNTPKPATRHPFVSRSNERTPA